MNDLMTYRSDYIEKTLRDARYSPLDVMVTGVTGAGKSTTMNAIFQKEVAKVGDGVDPETMEVDHYLLGDRIRLWDTPGLGDGVDVDKAHSLKLVKLLKQTYTHDDGQFGFVDLALIVIEGGGRDMGTTYKLINELVVPLIQKERILVVMNQADFAMKGKHWNKETNAPDSTLLEFLEEKSVSLQKRVKEATGVSILKPVYYSAYYGYNVEKLYDFIIDNIPKERRSLHM